MIDWTLEYIISQILVVIVYALISISYHYNDRKKILKINVVAHAIHAISFLLLNGLTGFAMCIVYAIRDLFFAIDEKNRKSKNLTKRDYIILLVFVTIIIISTIFTYNGLGSLLSVGATLISTVAIWQKDPKYYKLLGIPISLCWLGYDIYLKSIFAIVLEIILLISVISGCIKEVKNK